MEWEGKSSGFTVSAAFSISPLTLKELVHLLSPLTQNKLITLSRRSAVTLQGKPVTCPSQYQSRSDAG